MSLVIGLTGGIASGKSTVSNMLKEKRITVIDADLESRLAVEPGEEAYKKIVEYFGHEILLEDGAINRAKLGEIIFNNEEQRLALNQIVHPAVRKRMERKKLDAIERNEALIVLDIPLFFESPLTTYGVEKSLLVYVDEQTQLTRLMERNQYTDQEALARIKSQMPLRDKKRLADATIDNNGSIDETEKQLYSILKEWGVHL